MVTPTTTPAVYRPRRMRSDNPPPFQLTPRDIDILRAVARYRFLDSGHICKLIPGSPKNIRNRLKGLFEHMYLDRPECQYDFYRPGGGSSLAVYALADKGARLLARDDGFVQGDRVSWRLKNQTVGRPFLEHTLETADFSVGLRASVRNWPDVELLDGDDMLQRLPKETQVLAKPFRLNMPVIYQSTRHNIGVEPDYAFSLRIPSRKRHTHFLTEIDRGTMPVERADLTPSSILRKFLAYQAIWRSKQHMPHFGWRNFRVLVITSNTERARNMRDCLRRHTSGQGSPLFWFTDRHTLDWNNCLAHQWIGGDGNRHSLIPHLKKTNGH